MFRLIYFKFVCVWLRPDACTLRQELFQKYQNYNCQQFCAHDIIPLIIPTGVCPFRLLSSQRSNELKTHLFIQCLLQTINCEYKICASCPPMNIRMSKIILPLLSANELYKLVLTPCNR